MGDKVRVLNVNEAQLYFREVLESSPSAQKFSQEAKRYLEHLLLDAVETKKLFGELGKNESLTPVYLTKQENFASGHLKKEIWSHVGDFCLFMVSYSPQYISRRTIYTEDDYVKIGKEAYHHVSLLSETPDAALFSELERKFRRGVLLLAEVLSSMPGENLGSIVREYLQKYGSVILLKN